MDRTKPDDQIKALIGELVVTIAQLEAQKAQQAAVIEQLTAEVIALTPTPKEP